MLILFSFIVFNFIILRENSAETPYNVQNGEFYFIFCTGMSVCVCFLAQMLLFSPLKEITVFVWSIIFRMRMSVW